VRAAGTGNRCGATRVDGVALVTCPVLQWHSVGLEWKASHCRRIKPSALRPALFEASMNLARSSVCEVACDRAAPRCAPLRLAPGHRDAVRVWSLQASGLVARMNLRSTKHHRPNQPLKRTRRTEKSCFAEVFSARRLAALGYAALGRAVASSGDRSLRTKSGQSPKQQSRAF